MGLYALAVGHAARCFVAGGSIVAAGSSPPRSAERPPVSNPVQVAKASETERSTIELPRWVTDCSSAGRTRTFNLSLMRVRL